ncbi:hypothetical protein JG687_00005800 [Phytophthora cactorum]|uniref:Uncharacterized protein n=1 Tax=Phytophthora cactorum TaxID=29920 RepID=A0A8T1UM43_9STRA|nr:hypothetical protein JG687_00005800 [Phytophthora cactorum]
MLRRAIQRVRLHLPAPIGHDNGGGGSSSDEEDFPLSPSVAYTSLRDDESVRDHFRRRPEDVSGVHLIVAERTAKARKGRVADLSLDEQRRAADAWARLQTLYGLFRELETAADEDTEDSDTESMLVAAEQNRISPDAFEELGNCLYAEAASVAVSATA